MTNTQTYEFREGPETAKHIAEVAKCSDLQHVMQAMQDAREVEGNTITSWCSFLSDYDYNPDFKHCIHKQSGERPKVSPTIAYKSGFYMVKVWTAAQ